MSALDSENGSGGGEVAWVHNVLRGTEVRADSDTLEDIGNGEEGRDVSEAKGVRARSDGGNSGSYGMCQFTTTTEAVFSLDEPDRAPLKNATWVFSSEEISFRLP